jgi:hypothetical protein
LKRKDGLPRSMEANLEKMETNPEEKVVVVERQEILNEEAAIHSLRAC